MYIVLWALGPTRLLVQYIFLYYTFICTTHICLLYKGIHIYIYIYIFYYLINTIQLFRISNNPNYVKLQI